MTIRELDVSDFGDIKKLFREVFSSPPWNEDWSDETQLDEYLKDLTEVRSPLLFGLIEDQALIGISLGRIKHWNGGTEYCVEELCIRADFQGRGYGRKFFSLIEDKLKERDVHTIFLMTDRDMPAYGFYRRIGFTELPELTALYREF